MTPLEGLAYWLAVLLYTLAFGAGLAGAMFKKDKLERFAPWPAWIGMGFHAAAFALRWSVTGHVPTIGTYENVLAGGLIMILMALVMFRRPPRRIGLLGTLPFIILMMGVAAASDTSPRPFVASLRSFWLYVHIFFAWLAYAAFTGAAGVGAAYLLKSKCGKPADPLNELMFRLAAFGLVTDAVMIASGSIWAKSLWGSYWSWDPVETWSLVSFLLYGLILHLRVTLGWKGRRLAWLLIVSLVTVLVSFWGVNFVMQKTLHVFTVG
jgi:ABC-type transport system involved in cytochrome c biogenesis permease subunit